MGQKRTPWQGPAAMRQEWVGGRAPRLQKALTDRVQVAEQQAEQQSPVDAKVPVAVQRRVQAAQEGLQAVLRDAAAVEDGAGGCGSGGGGSRAGVVMGLVVGLPCAVKCAAGCKLRLRAIGANAKGGASGGTSAASIVELIMLIVLPSLLPLLPKLPDGREDAFVNKGRSIVLVGAMSKNGQRSSHGRRKLRDAAVGGGDGADLIPQRLPALLLYPLRSCAPLDNFPWRHFYLNPLSLLSCDNGMSQAQCRDC